jgi:hypothetical protein
MSQRHWRQVAEFSWLGVKNQAEQSSIQHNTSIKSNIVPLQTQTEDIRGNVIIPSSCHYVIIVSPYKT